MRWRRFLVANVTGTIALAGACTLAAYLAGGTLLPPSGTIDLIIGGTAALVIAASLLLLRRHAGGLAQRAEAAYPGPLHWPGLTMGDPRRETVFASKRQRPDPPAAGKVAEATVHPSPGHQGPAARRHRPAWPASVITRPVAPTVPPAQPAR
jgi:hypothetical protein